jgi:hypothetical protein
MQRELFSLRGRTSATAPAQPSKRYGHVIAYERGAPGQVVLYSGIAIDPLEEQRSRRSARHLLGQTVSDARACGARAGCSDRLGFGRAPDPIWPGSLTRWVRVADWP